jgi:hypothetical protein
MVCDNSDFGTSTKMSVFWDAEPCRLREIFTKIFGEIFQKTVISNDKVSTYRTSEEPG